MHPPMLNVHCAFCVGDRWCWREEVLPTNCAVRRCSWRWIRSWCSTQGRRSVATEIPRRLEGAWSVCFFLEPNQSSWPNQNVHRIRLQRLGQNRAESFGFTALRNATEVIPAPLRSKVIEGYRDFRHVIMVASMDIFPSFHRRYLISNPSSCSNFDWLPKASWQLTDYILLRSEVWKQAHIPMDVLGWKLCFSPDGIESEFENHWPITRQRA